MRIAIAALAAIALSACGQQSTPEFITYSDAQRECGGSGRPFVETWSCVRVSLSDNRPSPDIQSVFLATGDFVVQQVKEGKMTDAEAKLAMANARQRHNEDIDAREAARRASTPAPANQPDMTRAIVAASIMNQPSPFPPPAPLMGGFTPAPRVAISCTRTGPGSVMCY